MIQVVPSTNTTQVRARSTGTPNSIAVGSAQTYYEYSRDWAIKIDGMVEGVDYSSKYYANKSHEYADSILTDAGFIAVTESLTNINAVANNLDAINGVNNNITAIDGAYQYRYEITGVYNDLSSVRTVASNISNIDAVYSDLGYIEILANSRQLLIDIGQNLQDIETVADNMSDVCAVSYIKNAVTNVAGNSTRVTTVSNNIEDVQICSGNIIDIRTCATNINSIRSKVSKTGDTMTGSLTLPEITINSSAQDGANINLTNTKNSIVYHSGGIRSFHDSTNADSIRLYSGFQNNYSFFELNYSNNTSSDYVIASSGVKYSITHWSSPSNNQANNVQYITLQASGTGYTAPFDGWFVMMCKCTAAGTMSIHNSSVNSRYAVMVHSVWGGDWSSGQIEVNKGDIVIFTYGADMQFSDGGIFWLRRNGN